MKVDQKNVGFISKGIFIVFFIIFILFPLPVKSSTLINESFESGLPAGWTVIDNAETGAQWRFDDPGSRGNLTGGSGNFAIADSDAAGVVDMDTELRTPAITMSNMNTVILEFRTDFHHYVSGGDEFADVDISVNGASGPWTNVWRKTGADYRGPATEAVDITSIAAGQSSVMIRFHYYGANNDWWWQVDDVLLSGTVKGAVIETSFDSGIPSGWSVTDIAGNGAVWRFDDPGSRGNLTGGSGTFAIADSDNAGSADMDTELQTSSIDMSTLSTVTLEFKTDFHHFLGGGNEYADVDVSVNGASGPWTNVWRKTGGEYRGPATETVDITGIAAGQSSVLIRFYYYGANYDWWWQIDDVNITGCSDSDEDGYSDLNDPLCADAGVPLDCDDGNPAVNPGATEGTPGSTCSDSFDNDCDGAIDSIDGGCYTPSGEVYEFQRLWPTIRQPWYFNGPFDIAIDSSGLVYVVDSHNHRIIKFTSDGYLVTTWGGNGSENGEFQSPGGVGVDSVGLIYVADEYNHRIQKFDSNGVHKNTWGSAGTDDVKFYNPKDVAVDNSGYIYVVEYGNNRIQKLNSDGTLAAMWGWGVDNGSPEFQICPNNCKTGLSGSGEGQFKNPTGIAVDNSGVIYVADQSNHRIQKFNSDGSFVEMWGWGVDDGTPAFQICTSTSLPCQAGIPGSGDRQFKNPYNLALENDHVYISDSFNARIQILDSDGTLVEMWGWGVATGASALEICTSGPCQAGLFGTGDGQFDFDGSVGIAVNPDGFVYVADVGSDRINIFAPTGAFVNMWESRGTAEGQFHEPLGISVDGSGFIYAADMQNKRIQKYAGNGAFVEMWGWGVDNGADEFQICSSNCQEGIFGDGNGQFMKPKGIAIDSTGFVYILDKDRVQKLDANGQYIGQWGQFGSGDKEFWTPEAIAVDSNGFVYVADTNNDRISKFNGDGTLLAMWGWGVATGANAFQICTSDCQGGIEGSGEGQFFGPRGIAVDNGYVYVADWQNHRIQKFDSNGVYVTKWGDFGAGDDQLYFPLGIAVDGSGFVHVVDSYNGYIKQFTPDGQFVSKVGDSGNGAGNFSYPGYMDITSGFEMYVSDTGNNRLQKFQKVTTGSNNRAIIVAGGGNYEGNKLWDATRMNTNFAYQALRYQGFTKDRIFYMSEDDLDLDNNGEPDDVDDDPSLENLQNALCGTPCNDTGWASGSENVIVYIADHGGTDNVRVNATELLNGGKLNTWLSALQATISGNLIVIIDSCRSGSLMSSLSGAGRIIMTSTLADEKAYFISQGAVSYSSFLWAGIFNGLTIQQSHDNAVNALKDAVGSTVILQTPLLNDNVSGIAATYKIGNGTDYNGTAPVIGAVSAEMNGTNTGTITASVTDNSDGVARVWAVIMPPGFSLGSSDNAVQELPIVELSSTTPPEYEATYNYFNIEGDYRIAVYARDRKGDAANPKLTSLSVGSPRSRKAIIVAGGQQTDPNWAAVQKGALEAYNALVLQGYSDGSHSTDDIYFLSNVTFSAGIDGTATKSNLRYAICGSECGGGSPGWAMSNTYDVVLYMIGDGNSDEFFINLADPVPESRTVTAADLKGWLDILQNDTNGISDRVTVVYDADYSGSYSGALANDAETRILIGSSGGKASYLADGDISFSHYFWGRILNGWNVRDAFYHARSAMEFSTGQQQKAWIDDNGNGIGNENGDGALAVKYTIGVGIMLAGKDPLIGLVTADPLPAGQLYVTIHANDVTTVGTLAAVDPVWAVVTEPKGPGETTVTQTIVAMSDVGGNSYEGTTADIFTDFGKYSVTVYAKDDEGNISSVAQTTVYQKGLIDRYEDDDTYDIANEIMLNSSTAQQHNFHDSGDVDWVRFYGNDLAGKPYTFKADNLGTNSDVVMELHNETTASGGVSPPFPILWDNGGNGVNELHTYSFTTDGIYYLKVSNNSGVYGNDTGYDLSVYEESGELYFATMYGIVRDAASMIPIPGVTVNIPGSLPDESNPDSGFYTITVLMDNNPENHTLTATETPATHENFTYSRTLSTGLQYEVFVDMVPYCWDSDLDGYGDPGDASCSGGITDDCDDGDNLINPGAAEVCDGVDNNCAGGVDEGWPTSSWYVDNDGDSYGNVTIWQDKCYQPSGWVADNTDCDDSDEYIYPGGPEVRLVSPLTYYSISLLRDAYVAAGEDGTIQSKTSTYTGDFAFDRNKTVTFEGGYNCSYTTMTGETTIGGNVTVGDGLVTLENIEVQ